MNMGTIWPHVSADTRKDSITLAIFLPKMESQNVATKKVDKSKLRDDPQNNWTIY